MLHCSWGKLTGFWHTIFCFINLILTFPRVSQTCSYFWVCEKWCDFCSTVYSHSRKYPFIYLVLWPNVSHWWLLLKNGGRSMRDHHHYPPLLWLHITSRKEVNQVNSRNKTIHLTEDPYSEHNSSMHTSFTTIVSRRRWFRPLRPGQYSAAYLSCSSPVLSIQSNKWGD